jgi:hypothetical protein
MTRAQRRRSSGLACRERHPKPNGVTGSDQNSRGIRAKLSHVRVGSHPVELAGVEERDADRVLVLFHTLWVGARAEGRGYRPKAYGTGPRRAHLLGHRHVRPAAPYLHRARRRPRRAPLAPTSGFLSSEPSKGCAPRHHYAACPQEPIASGQTARLAVRVLAPAWLCT